MMRGTFVILFFAVAPALAGATTPPPATQPASQPADVVSEVQALLRELGTADYRARDRALARLVEIGPPAKESLERFVRRTDNNEARDRAGVALQKIRENEVLGPTFVTLRLKDARIHEAADALTRAGGRPFVVRPVGENENFRWRAASLDVRHAPFWEGVHAVCEAFGARPWFGAADGAVTLAPDAEGWSKRPWRSAPGCLVMLESAERIPVRDADLDRVNGRATRLRFDVYPDPALRPLTHSQYLEITEAKDELGQSLVPPNPIAQAVGSGSGAWSFEAGVFQPFDKPGGTRRAAFKGKAGLVLQSAGETFAVENVMSAKNVTRSVAGLKVTLHGATAVESGFAFRMTVVREGADDRVWELARDLYHPLAPRLIARGDRPATWVIQSDAKATRTADRVDATVVFLNGARPDAVPDKLVWELPTKTRVLEIPIEFENLPLP